MSPKPRPKKSERFQPRSGSSKSAGAGSGQDRGRPPRSNPSGGSGRRGGSVPAKEIPSAPVAGKVVLSGRNLPNAPWIYRKRVKKPDESIPHGAYVDLVDAQGKRLARGLYNRRSEIAFRMLGNADLPNDLSVLLQERLRAAWDLRTLTLGLPNQCNTFRWVNAEGDGLSGLIVDVYNTTAVASLYSVGWVWHAELLEAALLAQRGIDKVHFRSDARSQKLEGFRLPPLAPGLMVEVREGRILYNANLSEGHKTGLFLDQRDNRKRVSEFAKGRRVLDLCTNAGGFALAAQVQGGAKNVVGVDLDEDAIAAAKVNARLNRAKIDWVHADIFPWLKERSTEAADQFDLIILDPPKLATGPKDVDRALSTYLDMNRLAFQAAAPGAIMFTCSCSGAVSQEVFSEVVKRAARHANRHVRILEWRGAAADHPVVFDFPEGRYLKGFLLHID